MRLLFSLLILSIIWAFVGQTLAALIGVGSIILIQSFEKRY